MAIQLRLPGVKKDPKPSDHGVGDYGDLLQAEVVAECDVGALARGQADSGLVSGAEPNDVLELRRQGGIVELLRAGEIEDHYPQSVRSASGQIEIPRRKQIRGLTRGPRDIELESVKQIRTKIAEAVV